MSESGTPVAFSDELYDEAQDGIARRAVFIQISRLFWLAFRTP
jgi:hypothetical protein